MHCTGSTKKSDSVQSGSKYRSPIIYRWVLVDKSPLKSGENGRIGRSTFCRNFRFCRKPGARRNYPTTQCTVASSQVPHHASFFKVTCQKSVGNQKVSLGKMQILKSYNQFRGCGHNDNAMMYLNHGRCHDLLFMFFCTFIF